MATRNACAEGHVIAAALGFIVSFRKTVLRSTFDFRLMFGTGLVFKSLDSLTIVNVELRFA